MRKSVLMMLLIAATAFGFAGRQVLSIVVASSPPEPGELVPRQIPYRGYLERQGAPVDSTAQAMRFSLHGADAGLFWAENLSVPVQNGHFSVELGDSTTNPVPRAAFLDPSLELRIQLDPPTGPNMGSQRVLSVPFARTAQFPPNVLAGIERRCNGTGTQTFDGTNWGPCLIADRYCAVSSRSGCSAGTASASCKTLRADATFFGTDGVFWVDPDGAGGAVPFEAFCDMTTAGGGWTRALSIQAPNAANCFLAAAAAFDPAYGGDCAKLSDATINLLSTEKVFYTQIAGAEKAFTRYTGVIAAADPLARGQMVNSESYDAVLAASLHAGPTYYAGLLFGQYEHYEMDALRGAKLGSCLFSLEYTLASNGVGPKYAVCSGRTNRDQGMMFAYIR